MTKEKPLNVAWLALSQKVYFETVLILGKPITPNIGQLTNLVTDIYFYYLRECYYSPIKILVSMDPCFGLFK